MKKTRSIILRIIAAGHPIGMTEGSIAAVLKSLALDHAHTRIRAELRDLCDAGAIEIIDDSHDEFVMALGGGGWAAKLTPQGISLAGIANRSAGDA